MKRKSILIIPLIVALFIINMPFASGIALA
jgi:hypothetical protein